MITGVTIIAETVSWTVLPIILCVACGICALTNIVLGCYEMYEQKYGFGMFYLIFAILQISMCNVSYQKIDKVPTFIVDLDSSVSYIEFANTYNVIDQLDENTYKIQLKEHDTQETTSQGIVS